MNDATKGEYIYPTNKSKREYQYEIIRSCFTDNCLVALPTGLGKTFVAGVVMLNCGSRPGLSYILLMESPTNSLSVVSHWEDCLSRPDETIGQSTDRGVSVDLWNPIGGRCRDDGTECLGQGEGETMGRTEGVLLYPSNTRQ